jgi:hypothetical protein
MLQAAHSSPEKIAHLRAAYDRAVAGGWAGAGQLEWLDDEAAVLRRAPHLAGGEIKVRARGCVRVCARDTLTRARAGLEGAVERERGLGGRKRRA